LLQIYGFVIDENPYDSFPLFLQTDPAAPNYARKEAIMSKAGLNIAQTVVQIFKSDPSQSLDVVLQYIRIQRADEGMLAKMEENLGREVLEEEIENSLIRSLLVYSRT
jgi:hypothetical protein